MIDLHTHILPGIDDGARSLEISLDMARIAVADGTTVMACTPHIYPGLYMNDSAGIHRERDKLQQALDAHGIPLRLVVGADAHLVPELLQGLQTGRVPTLNGSRYFLLEPSHNVLPPGSRNPSSTSWPRATCPSSPIPSDWSGSRTTTTSSSPWPGAAPGCN